MEEQSHILVVEDSERLNNYISSQLKKENFYIVQAICGQQAYDSLKQESFDLVILDLNLGDINGLQILKTIRLQDKTLPVMIVSSLTDDETKIEGFRIGCDDYLTKPFYISELLMRIKRMLERREQLCCSSSQPIKEVILCGPFEIDSAALTVKKNNILIPMRKKYFDILLFLIQRKNSVIPYRVLYESVWGKIAPEESTLESNLYVNIHELRILIEEDPANPKYIISSRHVGYMFSI